MGNELVTTGAGGAFLIKVVVTGEGGGGAGAETNPVEVNGVEMGASGAETNPVEVNGAEFPEGWTMFGWDDVETGKDTNVDCGLGKALLLCCRTGVKLF